MWPKIKACQALTGCHMALARQSAERPTLAPSKSDNSRIFNGKELAPARNAKAATPSGVLDKPSGLLIGYEYRPQTSEAQGGLNSLENVSESA